MKKEENMETKYRDLSRIKKIRENFIEICFGICIAVGAGMIIPTSPDFISIPLGIVAIVSGAICSVVLISEWIKSTYQAWTTTNQEQKFLLYLLHAMMKKWTWKRIVIGTLSFSIIMISFLYNPLVGVFITILVVILILFIYVYFGKKK